MTICRENENLLSKVEKKNVKFDYNPVVLLGQCFSVEIYVCLFFLLINNRIYRFLF